MFSKVLKTIRNILFQKRLWFFSFVLGCALSLLLMACNVTEIDEQIIVEDLVGVWQQEGFVERLNMINRQNRDEDGNFEVVAVYVTADGNLFVLSISGSCTEGLMTAVRHFRYEVTEEGLALSFFIGFERIIF